MHAWKNGTCKRRIVSLLTVASAQAAELLVSSFNTNQVLRYEEATGAFLGALVAAGVTRNPGKALEVTVPFGPIDDGTFEPGDELSLIISARIGTNPNGNKCPGHSNAVGLRLSYDATHRGIECAHCQCAGLGCHHQACPVQKGGNLCDTEGDDIGACHARLCPGGQSWPGAQRPHVFRQHLLIL